MQYLLANNLRGKHAASTAIHAQDNSLNTVRFNGSAYELRERIPANGAGWLLPRQNFPLCCDYGDPITLSST